jgi:hypothetical protein
MNKIEEYKNYVLRSIKENDVYFHPESKIIEVCGWMFTYSGYASAIGFKIDPEKSLYPTGGVNMKGIEFVTEKIMNKYGLSNEEVKYILNDYILNLYIE